MPTDSNHGTVVYWPNPYEIMNRQPKASCRNLNDNLMYLKTVEIMRSYMKWFIGYAWIVRGFQKQLELVEAVVNAIFGKNLLPKYLVSQRLTPNDFSSVLTFCTHQKSLLPGTIN